MMKKFRYILLILFLLCNINIKANLSAAQDRIFISVVQVENNEIPSEAARQIELKLNELLMQNGIANEDPLNRFVLYTKVSILSKEIIPGPPQKIALDIDFTFIIGDAEENKKFESVSISSKGVGVNENKAFISAIKNIKLNNPSLISLVSSAKKEIIDYYSLKCSQIKKQAQAEAEQRNYEKAIYLLIQIPNVCDCAQECQDLTIQYSQDCITNQAAQLLNHAKSLWSSSPNESGASAVADIIAKIPANTSSQTEIDQLIAEINTKLKSDQKKAWDFKLKQYNDRIAKQKRDDQARLEQQRADNRYREKQQYADNKYRSEQQRANNEYRSRQQIADNDYRRTQQRANNEARKQSIEAARQIGIEYAKNQPKSITYQRNIILW